MTVLACVDSDAVCSCAVHVPGIPRESEKQGCVDLNLTFVTCYRMDTSYLVPLNVIMRTANLCVNAPVARPHC